MPKRSAAPAAALLLCVYAATGGAARDEKIAVVCPAIEQDRRRGGNDPDAAARPAELVALGVAEAVTKTPGHRATFGVKVEKVLYGSLPGKTVRFSSSRYVPAGERRIFALVPDPYSDPAPYKLKYHLPAWEEKSQRALSAARLDYNVLSSECIFVGKELSAGSNYRHAVEVIRSLHGPKLRGGQKVTVEIGGYMRRGDATPAVRGGSMIYFIRAIGTFGNRWKGIYFLNTRLPADREKDVLGALKRRSAHPVIEQKEGNRTVRRREVMFQGSVGEAIELMGSARDAAVTLGARKLVHHKQAARRAVAAAIEKELYRATTDSPSGFRRLRNLIRLLPYIDQGTPDGDAGRLLEKLIAHIASNAPQPPAVKRDAHERYWRREEDREDVNHALAWLLLVLDEKDVVRHYAKKLIGLRNAARGRWREEVQLALDAARVEDNIELSAALARTKDLKPIRSARGFRVTGEVAAFSHDGRFLASGGRVWNTSDWSPAGGLKPDPDPERLLFSPDDRYLYVFGGGASPERPARFDWRSGKLDKAFEGHKASVTSAALSTDGKTMVTASYFEDIIHVWDVATGKIVKSFGLGEDCFHIALSPDGKTLVRQTGMRELTVEPLRGGKPAKITLRELEPNEVVFSGDGRYLVGSSFGYSAGARTLGRAEVVLALYDAAPGYKLMAERVVPAYRCTAMAVSPDSKHLVLGDQNGRAWALGLPKLEPVRRVIADARSHMGPGALAFSPDGKMLVVGSQDDTVRLFRVGSFERVLPGPGHCGGISSLYFSRDGTQLRSLATDNTVCLWDAATMGVRKRISLPKHHTVVRVRPPDGRYALCASAADVDTPFRQGGKRVPPVQVVDLDTGKVVSKVALPVNWNFAATKVHWLNDTEALCIADGRWRRFNYRTGKMLDDRQIDIRALGELTEDGRHLFVTRGGGRDDPLEVEVVDIKTLASRKIGRTSLPRMTGNTEGLVPGGKYFYIGGPGIYIYDRKTLKLVAAKKLRGLNLLGIVFPPDGRRYAVVTGGRIFVDDDLRQHDPGTPSIIRIHDTLTGKTLFAFPAPTRWVGDLKFSPDGERLAVVGEGIIEMWHLGK